MTTDTKNCNDPECFPYCMGCNPGNDREWFVMLVLVSLILAFATAGILLIALYFHENRERLFHRDTSVYILEV